MAGRPWAFPRAGSSVRHAARVCAARRGHVSRVVPRSPYSQVGAALASRSAVDLRRAPLVFEVKPTIGAEDPLGEQIRRLRLRADGQRPLAVNLSETIALTRKLFELHEAAQLRERAIDVEMVTLGGAPASA